MPKPVIISPNFTHPFYPDEVVKRFLELEGIALSPELDLKKIPLNRGDLHLVQAITEFSPIKDDYGHLVWEVVEVPDDARWQIEDYDGCEWISEPHDSWSYDPNDRDGSFFSGRWRERIDAALSPDTATAISLETDCSPEKPPFREIAISTTYGGFTLPSLGWDKLEVRKNKPRAELWKMKIPRDDSDLIEVVHELNQAHKEDQIEKVFIGTVRIPGEIEWEIRQYDGDEWVVEKHRRWYGSDVNVKSRVFSDPFI